MSKFRIPCPSCGVAIGKKALAEMHRGVPGHRCDVLSSYRPARNPLSHPGFKPGSAEERAYEASERERLSRPRPIEEIDPSIRWSIRQAMEELQLDYAMSGIGKGPNDPMVRAADQKPKKEGA